MIEKNYLNVIIGAEGLNIVPKSYIQAGISDLRGYLKIIAKKAKSSQQKGRCDRLQSKIDDLATSVDNGANPIAVTNRITSILQQITLLEKEIEESPLHPIQADALVRKFNAVEAY